MDVVKAAVFPFQPVAPATSALEFMQRESVSARAWRLRIGLLGLVMLIITYLWVVNKHNDLIMNLDSDIGESLNDEALKWRAFAGSRASGKHIAFALEFPLFGKLLGYHNQYTPYFVDLAHTYYQASNAELHKLIYVLETAPAVIQERYEYSGSNETEKPGCFSWGSAMDLRTGGGVCLRGNKWYGDPTLAPNLFDQSLQKVFATNPDWTSLADVVKKRAKRDTGNPIMNGIKKAMPFINTAMMAAMFFV